MADAEWTTIGRGLVIRKPHIDRILAREKIWELRSSATRQRGPIALIESGSGAVVGVARLVDSLGPLSMKHFEANIDKHRVDRERLYSGAIGNYRYAWVLEEATRLKRPVKYEHRPGAVIWVSLDAQVASAIASEV